MKNKYEIKMTSRFKKDLKTVRKRNYSDVNLLNEIVEKLANDIPLEEKYNNHLLEPKSKRFMGMSFEAWLAIRIRKKQLYFDSNFNTNRITLWSVWIIISNKASFNKFLLRLVFYILRKVIHVSGEFS